MILQRLRVRAHRAPVGVEHAHRVGDDVEDRLELRDAAREILTQSFALGDVVAGEEQSASAGLVRQRGEGRLDEAAPPRCWKGMRAAMTVDAAQRRCRSDRSGRRARSETRRRSRPRRASVHARQVAIARVRVTSRRSPSKIAIASGSASKRASSRAPAADAQGEAGDRSVDERGGGCGISRLTGTCDVRRRSRPATAPQYWVQSTDAVPAPRLLAHHRRP